MNYLSSDSESDDEFVRNNPRVFRQRPNYYDIYSEQEFLKRFRISKASFEELLHEIRTAIQPVTLR